MFLNVVPILRGFCSKWAVGAKKNRWEVVLKNRREVGLAGGGISGRWEVATSATASLLFVVLKYIHVNGNNTEHL